MNTNFNKNETQSSSYSPIKLLVGLFLVFLVNHSVFAQEEHWTIDIFTSNFSAIPYGLLEVSDRDVLVVSNSYGERLTPMGRLSRNLRINDLGVNSNIFFQDRVNFDIFASYSKSQSRILVSTSGKSGTDSELVGLFAMPTPLNKNTIPLVFPSTEDQEYFAISQDSIHNFSIFSKENSTINYSIPHGTKDFTCYLIKEGIIYLATDAGNIYILSPQGNINQIASFPFQIFDLISYDNGFAIGGEKNEQGHIAVLSNSFEEIWSKTYTTKNCRAITATRDNGLVLTGAKMDGAGYLTKVSNEEEVFWTRDLLSPGVAVVESSTKNIYVIASGLGNNDQGQFLKLGPNGEEGKMIDPKENYPLAVNNVEAHVSNKGHLFNNGSNGNYYFPAGAETATFFAAELLMIGGQEIEAPSGGPIYIPGSNYNYVMGPMNNEDSTFFERIWSVKESDIQRLKIDMQDGKLDLDHNLDILEWPANGNLIFNSFKDSIVIDGPLAPFVDKNGDGIYNILDGDYPKIKGEQMLWWVFNDRNGYGPLPSLNLNIIGTMHALYCDTSNIAYNTSFLEFEITNNGPISHPDFKVGFWSDIDLGCHTDDYIGSVPELNTAFSYNQDEIDGTWGNECEFGASSFPDDIPIQSITLLNHKMDHFSYYYNSAFGGPWPDEITEPRNEQELSNYINGLWRDGTAISVGGNGYDSSNTTETPFAFSGEPSSDSEWSQCSAHSPEGDIKTILSSGLGVFNPGDQFNVSYALISSTDNTLPCPNLENVKENIKDIQSVYDNYGNSFSFYLEPSLSLADQSPITLDPGSGAATYEWSTNETTQTISIDQPGNYSVTITNGLGCQEIYSTEISPVNQLVVINEEKLLISPNPTQHNFVVQWPDINLTNLKLTISSIDGKTVFIDENIPEGKTNYEVDHSLFDPGIYFLRVFNSENSFIGKISIL